MLRIITLISLLATAFQLSANDTVKVSPGKFIYKTELPGIILGSETQEVKLKAKQWQNWVVVEAATHGQLVKKGEVVAVFEDEAYKQEVENKERNLKIQKANLDKARKAFEINMKKMELERKKSKLAAEAAVKKALIYKEKGYDLAKVNYEQDLKDARNSLLYQQEELNQLKKMYDEDKITEETEEIVLKRQLNRVESLTKRIKSRELAVEEALNIKLPGDLFNIEYMKEKALLDEENNKFEWEIFALVENLKLKSSEFAYKKAEKAFDELQKDAEFLKVKAEMDGVVYYGALSGGKWTNQAGTELKKGKSLLKGSKLFTIVGHSAFEVESTAKYEQVSELDEKAGYFVDVPGAGVKKLSLVEKASVPNNGSFKTILKFSDSKGLFHGTSVKVSVIKNLGDSVISLPVSAVKSDEEDPTKIYVETVKDGKTEKAYVITGTESGGKVVILEGLNDGDVVKVK